MPKHFTILAPLLGVQLRLFRKGQDGKVYLPPSDESLYEVRINRAMLGGARHPETKEVFLFVYTKADGVHMMMTGEQLGVTEDGIVG